jgi:hypothetical protein
MCGDLDERGVVAMSRKTKWWWLGFFGVQTWTVEERNVRMALGLTVLVIAIVGLLSLDVLLGWFGVDPHVSAPLAALVSIVPAFYSARSIASILYPDLLTTADQNAEKRLSGSIDETT